MTPEDFNKEIDDACQILCGGDHLPGLDYSNNLNACHGAEIIILSHPERWRVYKNTLAERYSDGVLDVNYTAYQRTVALWLTWQKIRAGIITK